MGDCRVDGPTGPVVKSPEEMIGRFQGELLTLLPEWKAQLRNDPGQLGELERQVHGAFARGASLLVVGLIASISKQDWFQEQCEQTRQGFSYRLECGRLRQVRVRMLGGLVMWISSMYCVATSGTRRAKQETVPGVHLELVQFGFGKLCTPGLESKVARQAALCPSLQFAKQELERDGVKMDVKTVRRIATQCGEGMLHLRTHELELWSAGELAAGEELAGKHISVQVDGGRARIRGDLTEFSKLNPSASEAGEVDEDEGGRSKPRSRRSFQSEWREPKLVTIFVHDENGRMEKKSRAYVDGTFEGPDALAELVAMHLHRLGAAKALSVTFVSDGAVWIWDRLPKIVEMAGLKDVKIHEVLDCHHAVHHVSLALAGMGLSETERNATYRELRTQLRNGRWSDVVLKLMKLAEHLPEDSTVWTEIAYLNKHGEAGRLKYPTFRGLGVPLGSGAIESNIRRVVNLRIKGNSIFWRKENAEAMLQLRAQVVTNRWDARLSELRSFHTTHRRTDWHWQPRDMSSNSEGAKSGRA